MFKKLEGDQVMLSIKGVYKVCDLYEWDGKLFASVSGGFVRLRANGTTTKLDLDIVHMEHEGDLYGDSFGRLCTVSKEGYKALSRGEGSDDKPFMLEKAQ